MRLFKPNEQKRFKEAFANELLEFYFEKWIGKNPNNKLPWRVIVENKVQPQVDILCEFSDWLIAQGWSREVVEELFFVVTPRPKGK